MTKRLAREAAKRVGFIVAAALLGGAPLGKANPFDEMMERFVAENHVPGAAMAAARGGKVVYSRGFGEASASSRFRIASVSKCVTAVAVMRLVEEGRVGLDEPVMKYLEGVPVDGRWGKITVRHLLSHTGGFDREASFDPMFRAKGMGTTRPGDIVRMMMGRKLDFEPGERYAYSNFGFCLLGRVIERVTGRGYEEYVRGEILKPMGIEGMRVGRSGEGEGLEGEVRYHSGESGGGTDRPARGAAKRGAGSPYTGFYIEPMDSHGGWVATAEELVRFATSLDKVLKRESVEEMWRRPGFAGVGKGAVFYGLGWQVREVGGGRINVWHTGLLDGTSSLLVKRWDGWCWAVLFNTDVDQDGKRDLAGRIDPLVHGAADRVKF